MPKNKFFLDFIWRSLPIHRFLLLLSSSMPPLSNQDLLAGITDVINSALDTSLRARFEALQNEFNALRASNEKIVGELTEKNTILLDLNKALIERRDNVPPGTVGTAMKVPTTNISVAPPSAILPEKLYFDCLLLTDSIYRHVGVACPRDAISRVKNLAVEADFSIGTTSINKLTISSPRPPYWPSPMNSVRL